jgi:sulfite reductase (NADPH) flavoprotein alpha-component
MKPFAKPTMAVDTVAKSRSPHAAKRNAGIFGAHSRISLRFIQATLICAFGLWAIAASAAERHADPDGCFSCHGLPGLEFIDKDGVRRVATILQSDYYGSLHGSVPCKDCHRKIERYPHKPEEGYVDCSESCHVEEPSKGKPFTHKDVVDEFKESAHGSGHAPGATKEFHGGNRLKEANDQQNPSCRRCHSNTPYISESQIPKFKEAFGHMDTQCGNCHQGETWRNQFSGHILRRMVGKHYNKIEANAMCVDCHGDEQAMAKVKLQDYKTKEKKEADFRWVHATDSYDKTLHGRFLAVGDESGASCLDCHAPNGNRHGVKREEVLTSSTHPDQLDKTCSQAGCHGYSQFGANEGFTKTDVHAVDMLQLGVLPVLFDRERWDESNWAKAAVILGPLMAIFALASFLWTLMRRWTGEPAGALVGQDGFNRIMLGFPAPNRPSVWKRIAARWLGGAGEPEPLAAVADIDDSEPITSMTVLYASQTGNGEGIAMDLAAAAEARGYTVNLADMGSYDPAGIAAERLLFVICSTHGEGEPPIPAADLHAYLYSEDAPRLPHLKFGVLALGDSSYKHFCRAGKDFDAFLERLGGKRVLHRVDADADFEELACQWIGDVIETYRTVTGDEGHPVDCRTERADARTGDKCAFSRNNPYPAEVVVNRNLNGEGSSKETRHIEIAFGDSGLRYEAGDALGVYPKNHPSYVESLLSALRMNSYAEVTLGNEAFSLREALFNRLDTTTLSRNLIEKYAELTGHGALHDLLADGQDEKLESYMWGRHLLDLVEDHPPDGVSPQAFVGVLRRLPARLYSIASSQKAHPQHVHLTVGVVRYHAHNRDREGVCSTFLADRLGDDERLGIYVQPNKHFRLPNDTSKDIVMVGPGTGIAPFRGFVEDREQDGGTGRNWLFFGDQHRACDFLYADEWEEKLKRGVLNRMDLAFSRDQEQKVYVQTRMLEQGRDLYDWLENGAYFYVCGDASRMANDVHEALIRIVEQTAAVGREKAEAYVQGLMDQRRYLRDVY